MRGGVPEQVGEGLYVGGRRAGVVVVVLQRLLPRDVGVRLQQLGLDHVLLAHQERRQVLVVEPLEPDTRMEGEGGGLHRFTQVSRRPCHREPRSGLRSVEGKRRVT